MAVIRGKFVVEVEKSMVLRRMLRVLLWPEQLTQQSWLWLTDLDILRQYLHHELGDVCNIQLLVLDTNMALIGQAEALGLEVIPVDLVPAVDEIADDIDSLPLRQAIATGLNCDSDYIVVPNELLPYVEPVEEHFHIGLVDPSFLLRCVEIFVRGFGVAWSFANPILNQTFNTFYQFSERIETFEPGFTLMNLLGSTNQDSMTVDTGRTLIFNRTVHMCYSRDKLLFYSLQRDAALRLNAIRQNFAQELAYHLNFYYLLLYGSFDHAALLVNAVCGLGLDERDVGAKYKKFLEALEPVSPALHAIFTEDTTTELLDRFGALRNYAAHRGSIAPSKLVEKPDKEPTNEEIDAYIHSSAQDAWMLDLPDSARKTMLLGLLRSNTKMELLEQNTIDKDIVIVNIKGKQFIIHPLLDTTWNFRRTVGFLQRVYAECIQILRPPVHPN
jgi:hypothetical protein